MILWMSSVAEEMFPPGVSVKRISSDIIVEHREWSVGIIR